MFDSEVKQINKKTVAISLILLTALSATIGALFIISSASASSTPSNADTNLNATTSAASCVNQTSGMPPFGGFMANNQAFGDQPFGGGHGGPGGMGGMGGMQGMQNLELSSAYNATINNILGNDTDVQNLVAQGYNVTAIHPIVHNVIGADGTITTQASTAIVAMQNGDSGFATVKVDITNSKVTQIVIVTRTVINK